MDGNNSLVVESSGHSLTDESGRYPLVDMSQSGPRKAFITVVRAISKNCDRVDIYQAEMREFLNSDPKSFAEILRVNIEQGYLAKQDVEELYLVASTKLQEELVNAGICALQKNEGSDPLEETIPDGVVRSVDAEPEPKQRGAQKDVIDLLVALKPILKPGPMIGEEFLESLARTASCNIKELAEVVLEELSAFLKPNIRKSLEDFLLPDSDSNSSENETNEPELSGSTNTLSGNIDDI